jgi:hypothetical protein
LEQQATWCGGVRQEPRSHAVDPSTSAGIVWPIG